MSTSRFIHAAVMSLASLLIISDSGYGEESRHQKTSLFTPISADIGADHLHLAVLQTAKNLFDTDENTYCTAGLTLLEGYDMERAHHSNYGFYAWIVPQIEIGRKFENTAVSKVAFFGKSGFLNAGNLAWFDYGIVALASLLQIKAGVFRGTIYEPPSHRDNLDDLSIKRSYSDPAAVSYITVGLSPTFRF